MRHSGLGSRASRRANFTRTGKIRCEEHPFKEGVAARLSQDPESMKSVRLHLIRPYQEPVLVPLAEKAKAWQGN